MSACNTPLRRLRLASETSSDQWPDDLDADWIGELQQRPLEYGVAEIDCFSDHPYVHTGLRVLAGESAVTLAVNAEQLRPDDLTRKHLRHLYVEAYSHPEPVGWLAHHPAASKLQSLILSGVSDPQTFAAGRALTGLRWLEIFGRSTDFLSGLFCPRLLRLGCSPHGPTGLDPLLRASLPELRDLAVRGIFNLGEATPLLAAGGWPNLTTLRLPSVFVSSSDNLSLWVNGLAKASFPHLSLVGIGTSSRRWWVVGDGRAEQVPEEIDPMCKDWCIDHPTDHWG